jgi:hypothetical protein
LVLTACRDVHPKGSRVAAEAAVSNGHAFDDCHALPFSLLLQALRIESLLSPVTPVHLRLKPGRIVKLTFAADKKNAKDIEAKDIIRTSLAS